MADSVGAVHVEFTTSTAQFQKDVNAGSQSIRNFAGEARAAAQSTSVGAGASGTYTATFGKLGEKVKGAAASIAGFSQAAAAMGATVSPAVKGMGTALGALLSGGFTPLGLAIGAVTAGLALFSRAQDDAAKSSKVLKDELSEQVTIWTEIQKLRISTRAAQSGVSVEDLKTSEQLTKSRRELLDIEKQLERQDAQVAILSEKKRKETAGGHGMHSEFSVELSQAQKRLDSLMFERDVIARLVKDLEALTNARRAEAAAKEKANESGIQAYAPDFEGAGDRMDPRSAADIAEARHARAESERLFDERQRQRMDEIAAEKYFAQQMADFEAQQSAANGTERMDPRTDAEQKAAERWKPEVKKAQEVMTEIDTMSKRVSKNFGEGFGDAFASFVTGAQSAAEAFKQFAASFIRDVTSMIAKQMAMKLLASGATALGLAAFAEGGSFAVGGTGGTDSQLVAFRASPGEQVTIDTPGQRNSKMGGGNVYVNVHTLPGTTASTSTSNGPNGKSINVVIEEVVAGSITRGGKVGRAMDQAYGTRKRGRRE